MAKTYMSTIKYEVLANYEVQGVVDKPDIVGAIFGQSEGLLGQDMDLKELQQNGKIGRIEITVNKGKGTTAGQITIPSSLDQVKTSILAATMETVEKVGPFEAKVRVIKVSDTRKEKREVITERAKELLKNMQKFEGVETDEMAQGVKEDLRTEDVVEYNGLTAGPEVATSEEIIVVEGRADVLKLLSYGIKNAIAMNGANITPELIELCNQKTVTILVDGDRGGELNTTKLISLTKVDYIAKAPDGKEVEELTQKEILLALKRKQEYKAGAKFEQPTTQKPFGGPYNTYRPNNGFQPRGNGYPQQFERGFSPRPQRFGRPNFRENNEFRGNNDFRGNNNFRGNNDFRPSYRPNNGFGQSSYGQPRPGYNNFRQPFEKPQFAPRIDSQGTTAVIQAQELPKEFNKLKKDFEKLKGKSKARLFDAKKKKIKDVEVKDLLGAVEASKKKIKTIIFDGIVTSRLVETAEKNGVENLIGVKKGNIQPTEKLKVYTM